MQVKPSSGAVLAQCGSYVVLVSLGFLQALCRCHKGRDCQTASSSFCDQQHQQWRVPLVAALSTKPGVAWRKTRHGFDALLFVLKSFTFRTQLRELLWCRMTHHDAEEQARLHGLGRARGGRSVRSHPAQLGSAEGRAFTRQALECWGCIRDARC